MADDVPALRQLCVKVAQYVEVVSDRLDVQAQTLAGLQKEAHLREIREVAYRQALKKAAQVLYETDFFSEEAERRKFLKEAAADPNVVVATLIKVCHAADVALIGTPARVALKNKQGEEFDPVKAKAFGLDPSSLGESALDDI
jgi:hypothetical protein